MLVADGGHAHHRQAADGGPAHHWQAADRHGQEAENLLLHHASVAMSWCGLSCTTAKPGGVLLSCPLIIMFSSCSVTAVV